MDLGARRRTALVGHAPQVQESVAAGQHLAAPDRGDGAVARYLRVRAVVAGRARPPGALPGLPDGRRQRVVRVRLGRDRAAEQVLLAEAVLGGDLAYASYNFV